MVQRREVPNDNEQRSLLQRRCILEYSWLDSEGEICTWYDVHPLIFKIPRFLEELDKLES